MSNHVKQYNSLFEKNVSPFLQAGLICGGGILLMLGSWALTKSGIWETKDIFAWEMAFSAILFYAFFNSVFSLSQRGQNYYFVYSILSYFCLVVFLGLSAWLFSGLTIDEAGSFRWMLIIFTFSYLLLISIVGGMKKVVQLAQDQEASFNEESETK